MNDQTITATSGDDDSKASPDARPMSDDVSGTTAHPVIEDVAPRRIHDFGDLVHAVSAVLLAAVAILSSIYLSGFVTGVESDAHSAGRALNWMVDLPTSMLQQLTIVTIAVMAIVQLLVGREWLQSALALLAMFGGLATVWGISMAVSTFGNFTFITALSSPSSIIGTGLLPDFYAGSAALLTVAGPRRTRSTVKWGWNILYISSAILILLLIGAISGTWMVSGVVPTMIHYGLEVLHPSFFLVASCAICAVVSLMTGSSWTTIATIGVALMGIGRAMEFPEGWVAGAIISGAYFGDKLSLLSDTTVLASSTVGVPLFTHIRYMLYTTVPSMAVALGVFTAAGFWLDHGAASESGAYAAALASSFHLSPWLLLVPLATGILIARKLPAIVTLFCAVVFACVAMLLAQPDLVARVAGVSSLDFMSGFKGVLMSCFGPTALPTGSAELDALVATRGMSGMLNTVWLIICAMCFGGVMTGSGMLRSLTELFLRFVRRSFSAVASTVGAGIFFNLCTADQYISIILSGRLFKDLYAERGFEERLLSRSVEDSATVCSVLVPWNSCGMTQATVLGVSTFVYLPYCIFNIVSPLMSLLVAALGWGIAPPAAPAAAPGRAQQAQ